MPIDKIVIQVDRSSRLELNKRAERMAPSAAPLELDGINQSIHFLRGVSSRASLCLPAFHFLVGSSTKLREEEVKSNYPLCVSAGYMEFSCLNTITLACRKAFDHSISGLTGARFAKTTDEVLAKHAAYWAASSGKPSEEAALALQFLREFFRTCSKHSNILLRSPAALQKRIGLLKQHADRSAAHLSLDTYELDLLDVAHFVAAFCLVGEIVRSFDAKHLGENYFRQVDAAAAEEAKRVFMHSKVHPIFKEVDPVSQARSCWRYGNDIGLQMLLEQIPYAISWF